MRFVHSPRAFLRLRLRRLQLHLGLGQQVGLSFERAANCFFGCPCSCHNLHSSHSAGARALWGRLLDPARYLLQKGKLATTMPPGQSRIVASVCQIIRTNVSAHSLIQVRALTASIIRHSRDKQAVKSQLSVSALVIYSLSWRIIFAFAAKNKHKTNLQVNSKSTSITS